MKKIVIVIVIFFLVVSMAEAAFEKGTKSVGGSISFTSYKSGGEFDATFYGFGVWPQFSYFPWKNVCIDVSPGLGFSWDDYSNSRGLSLGVGARYFIKHFYGGLHFVYRYDRYKNDETESRHKSKSKHLTLSAGYLIPLSGNIYLDFGVSYLMGIGNVTSWNTFRYDGETVTNDWSEKNEEKRWKTALGVKIFFK